MSDLTAVMKERFGFGEFRTGQEAVICALTAGRSALAVFPTGAGKSLCYQLPALSFEGVTLVVSPLIALMKDQIDFLVGRGIPAARLDSSLSASEAFDVQERVRNGTLKLLYVAPERFNNERFLDDLRRTRISLFAVDEAHCISEWGHNFRPDYLKLAETARAVKAERVLALTATATPDVVKDICAAFEIAVDDAVVTGFHRPNLNLLITPVTAEGRDDFLVQRMQSRNPGSAIVYVTLQKTAERIALLLSGAGLSAYPYHAGMKDDERASVQESWQASDQGIVVATIAFGMGIDKSDVRYVYHYNLPKSLESYSQEIGRAGRDGKRSVVELLACRDDVPTLQNFAYGDTPTERSIRGVVSEIVGQMNGTMVEQESGGGSFSVDLYELSNRHDIRQLVLRTALTYLELLGVVRQGTPFYAGYEMRPLRPIPAIAAEFPGEHGQFVADLFARARAGTIWFKLNPDTAAEAMGRPRARIVRALQVMEERGLIELRASDVRHRYFPVQERPNTDAIVVELLKRFERRETQEIERLAQVLSLAELDGCQTNALIGYFGEARSEPCGHCGVCVTGRGATLPELPDRPAIESDLNVAEFRALRQSHPHALGEARQAARFLCGLTSPALISARLNRNGMFGALESRPFHEVMEWCA